MNPKEGHGKGIAQAFSALDGTPLHGSWRVPASAQQSSHVVVVTPGAGIPAAYYDHLTSFLCCQGLPTFVFDYRGVCGREHRRHEVRRSDALTWGREDIGGALEHARSRYPNAKLAVVTHSFSAVILGAARAARDVDRAVFLAPHTGYWGDYHGRWRWLLYPTWHIFMPLMARAVGYFPGRALGFGADLPQGVALEWGARMQPALAATQAQVRKWGSALAEYKEFKAKTLLISITDDAFAPPKAATTLLNLYPGLSAQTSVAAPADLGQARLGHMAFLRRRTGRHFWEAITAWILLPHAEGTLCPAPEGDGTDALASSP